MYGHLVTVKVSVESGTGERVQVNGTAFNQRYLEGLNTQAMQCRRTVEQHRALFADIFQHIPHFGALAIDHAFGALDVVGVIKFNQAAHDKGLEEFQGHLLGQTALVQLQSRPNHDDGTARVVDAFTQQVAAETTLLALEHIAQALQLTLAAAANRTATAAIVDQTINRFLQHALFVAHDHIWRAQLHQPVQAIVAVDHTAIEIVEIAGGKTTTIKLHHRAQVGRDHR